MRSLARVDPRVSIQGTAGAKHFSATGTAVRLLPLCCKYKSMRFLCISNNFVYRCILSLTAILPVCVRRCRFSSEGLSKFFPQIKQGRRFWCLTFFGISPSFVLRQLRSSGLCCSDLGESKFWVYFHFFSFV